MEENPTHSTKLGVLLRVGVFAFLAITGLLAFGWLLVRTDSLYFVSGALSSFAAAAIANSIAMRIYERGRLADIGLGWHRYAMRHLLIGVTGGVGAALLVVGVPFLVRSATFEALPTSHFNFGALFLVTLVLLFGAVGEEMLFRGYGFQVLAASIGPWATVLPMGVLFAMMHASNPNATLLGLVNTAGWGILLGAAFLRSGDLWLPIGLHFGWNWALPMLGARVSGFTIEVTGYAVRWHGSALWGGGDYGPEAGLPTLFAILLLAAYLWRAPIRKQQAFLLRGLDEEA